MEAAGWAEAIDPLPRHGVDRDLGADGPPGRPLRSDVAHRLPAAADVLAAGCAPLWRDAERRPRFRLGSLRPAGQSRGDRQAGPAALGATSTRRTSSGRRSGAIRITPGGAAAFAVEEGGRERLAVALEAGCRFRTEAAPEVVAALRRAWRRSTP
jgi:hypothetical protein